MWRRRIYAAEKWNESVLTPTEGLFLEKIFIPRGQPLRQKSKIFATFPYTGEALPRVLYFSTRRAYMKYFAPVGPVKTPCRFALSRYTLVYSYSGQTAPVLMSSVSA